MDSGSVCALKSPETERAFALVVAEHPNTNGVSPDIVKKVKWKPMKVGPAESAGIKMVGLRIRDSLLKLRHELVIKIVLKLQGNQRIIPQNLVQVSLNELVKSNFHCA